jgi:hypothetical protein
MQENAKFVDVKRGNALFSCLNRALSPIALNATSDKYPKSKKYNVGLC